MAQRIVIIGGVAGGMTTAAKAKRGDPQLDITVFERSHFISYSACGMPYYLEGKVPQLSRLVARTPARMRDEGIDVRVRHEVTTIDAGRKQVSVRNLETSHQFEHPYDALVIATGARAIPPDLPGNDLAGVYTLRLLEDIRAVREGVDAGVREVVVVGGGYIGLEMAEAFREVGLNVKLVEQQPRLLGPFDADIAEIAQQELEANGVEVRLDTKVSAFSGERQVRAVVTPEETLEADLVLYAAGAAPNSELAESVGVPLGPKRAVLTDAQQRTPIDGIYAVGDVTAVHHRVLGEPVWLPLGDTANRQARVLGDVLAGRRAHFPGVLGTLISKVFARGFAKTGLSHQEAAAAGIDVSSRVIHTTDRASYYPNAKPLVVKLVWQRDTFRLLGAQIVGYGDAAKRIDVVATLLYKEATLEDLANLDLAYAPPYSSALDALLVAANVALQEA